MNRWLERTIVAAAGLAVLGGASLARALYLHLKALPPVAFGNC